MFAFRIACRRVQRYQRGLTIVILSWPGSKIDLELQSSDSGKDSEDNRTQAGQAFSFLSVSELTAPQLLTQVAYEEIKIMLTHSLEVRVDNFRQWYALVELV